MAEIVPLARIPVQDVEKLLDTAFGTDRFGRTAYRLRKGTQPILELSFATIDETGALIGTIQCWPVKLVDDAGNETPMVMLGPVAVEPALQQGGIGRAMMRATLDAWEKLNLPTLMMIGDPEYYGRFFDFTADDTGAWVIDGPVERRRLLARAHPGVTIPHSGEILPRTD